MKKNIGFDWVGILAAALLYMALGFIWYSKALFFPEWSRQMGLLAPKMEWYAIPGMFLAGVLYAIGLSRGILAMNLKSLSGGILTGLAMAVCYVFMANSGKLFFAGKPSLFLIDFGFQSVAGMLMGGIIGIRAQLPDKA
jgi:hypothetical protein